MKTTILLFLLSSAFLTGCSGNFNYPSHKITVYKTDSSKKEYDLLSVRADSAIVVLDWKEAKVSPIPFSHAEVLRKDSILRIERDGHGGWVYSTFLGALIGSTLGSVIEFGPIVLLAALFPAPILGSPGGTGQRQPIPKAIVIGTISGAVIGGGIGIAFPPSKEPLLTSDSDRVFLRSISHYPDKEPEEMKYIK